MNYYSFVPPAFVAGILASIGWSFFHAGSAWIAFLLGTTIWLAISAFAVAIVERKTK